MNEPFGQNIGKIADLDPDEFLHAGREFNFEELRPRFLHLQQAFQTLREVGHWGVTGPHLANIALRAGQRAVLNRKGNGVKRKG